ncbi:GNAT family N-acetyltransferase [Fictibacillus phosphorivorans]|uniref:GNAT family N-acetyltransferase n=1 Tax=Fictibacillus phosphorivorans TaxID=1221500 RepID=UPI00203FE149|nr:GNAT family N-acetyltransferase [Fictibacillus phosphorivorans]MCM3718283.1 GNAT family N-acetyltransferase [Fictibacillus phosphorivorans]MCM3775851.1 GNAT family N-acetyltransferase [Fictibacillus phosphorivorans]
MKTERLQFRCYTNDDFPFFASLWGDPEVVQFIGKGVTRSTEEAQKSFQEWILPGYREGRGLYLVLHKETGQPIGHAGVVQQAVDGKKEFEIGYWIAKEYWGNGYATEAAAFLKQYASQQLGLKRLICLIQQANKRSINVALKLGMKHEKNTRFNTIPVNVYAWSSDQ